MASYDSDSDGFDAEDYTETNVLLGYVSKDSGDEAISHLGGRPVGLEDQTRIAVRVYSF